MAANAASFTATLIPALGLRTATARLRRQGSDLLVPACMVAMGASAFPICETLLLQTAVFCRCLEFPSFYGLATMVLFMLGLPIMVAQNRCDQDQDRIHGAKAAAIFRVVLGHSVQLLSLASFLMTLRDMNAATSDTDRVLLLSVAFSFIGIGCAIVYGAYAQTVSMFPEKYHPYFFIGTYLVSFIVAPVNVMLGELCTMREPSGKPMATPEMHWDKMFEYYGIGSVLNIAGCVMFVIFTTSTDVAGKAFKTKDDQLSSPILSVQTTDEAARSAQQIQHSDAAPPQLPAAGSAPPLGLCAVWSRCLGVGCVMAMCLLQNLLVCGEYARLPIQGQIPALRTLMMYSYYGAQCVGACVAMIPLVSQLITIRAITVLTVLRVPGAAMAYICATPDSLSSIDENPFLVSSRACIRAADSSSSLSTRVRTRH
eukprot:COSAG05_NODE_181_length_14767_cov_9.554859_5_plen_427_part_00